MDSKYINTGKIVHSLLRNTNFTKSLQTPARQYHIFQNLHFSSQQSPTKSFRTTNHESHNRKMKLLSLLSLLSTLPLVLAVTPTLPEDPTPILLAPRQLVSSSNSNCQNCARRCETKYGKRFPHYPAPPGLCNCLKDCKKKTIPQPCLIVYDGCNLDPISKPN